LSDEPAAEYLRRAARMNDAPEAVVDSPEAAIVAATAAAMTIARSASYEERRIILWKTRYPNREGGLLKAAAFFGMNETVEAGSKWDLFFVIEALVIDFKMPALARALMGLLRDAVFSPTPMACLANHVSAHTKHFNGKLREWVLGFPPGTLSNADAFAFFRALCSKESQPKIALCAARGLVSRLADVSIFASLLEAGMESCANPRVARVLHKELTAVTGLASPSPTACFDVFYDAVTAHRRKLPWALHMPGMREGLVFRTCCALRLIFGCAPELAWFAKTLVEPGDADRLGEMLFETISQATYGDDAKRAMFLLLNELMSSHLK